MQSHLQSESNERLRPGGAERGRSARAGVRGTFPRLVLASAAASAALAVLFGALAPGAGAAEPPEPGFFQFESLNRAYEMDDSEMAPVRQGPVTIHLSSPRNALVLRSHSVTLRPLGDGTYRALVGVEFLGSGDLVAILATDAGTSSRLEDLVVVPRQRLDLDGRVRFERVASGWDVTALSLPAKIGIDIQSRLAGSLVTLCDQMAVFLGLDCGGMERALSRVEVPLPEPGSVFFLPEAELTAAEVAAFDRYLGFR